MRTRRLGVLLAVAVVSAGAFFAGREAVSERPGPPHVTDQARFQPFSVSLVSASEVWTLGTAPCSNRRRCLALLTADGVDGSWQVVGLPVGLAVLADRTVGPQVAVLTAPSTLNVRFANARDGWLFGSLVIEEGLVEPVLWSTHDGGVIWHQTVLTWADGSVFDVEASDGTVQLMAPTRAGVVRVESSPVGADAWHVTGATRLDEPAGGSLPTGAFVLKGNSGLLVVGNDRGTTGSARLASSGRWVAWTPPCASVGGTFAVPAAATMRDLAAICTMGGYAESLSRSAPMGATLGSNWLYFSMNDGESFVAGPELRPTRALVGDEVLASPTPNTVFLDRSGPLATTLVASFDHGVHWQVVSSKDVYLLSFVGPTLGVGLARSASGAVSMVSSVDGGRQWETESF